MGGRRQRRQRKLRRKRCEGRKGAGKSSVRQSFDKRRRDLKRRSAKGRKSVAERERNDARLRRGFSKLGTVG